jgi:ankyrin repeat protein
LQGYCLTEVLDSFFLAITGDAPPSSLPLKNGSVDVLDILRNHGQDLNETTVENGWTALHLAVENRRPHAVEWLVKNRVDKEAKIRDGPEKGMTAKELAELKGRPRCVELLQ